MEPLALVDTIDDLVHEAKPVPLTDQVRVDRAEMEALVERLRDATATLADAPAPLAMHELEESGARAVYAQGEDACVAHLVRLSRAARAAAAPEPADPREAVDVADRLIATVREAKPVPLTGDVRVVREEVYELLDGLRAKLPQLVAPRTSPPDLDETAARLLCRQGEAAAIEALVRLSRATAPSSR